MDFVLQGESVRKSPDFGVPSVKPGIKWQKKKITKNKKQHVITNYRYYWKKLCL
jgi:hypothetical protein